MRLTTLHLLLSYLPGDHPSDWWWRSGLSWSHKFRCPLAWKWIETLLVSNQTDLNMCFSRLIQQNLRYLDTSQHICPLFVYTPWSPSPFKSLGAVPSDCSDKRTPLTGNHMETQPRYLSSRLHPLLSLRTSLSANCWLWRLKLGILEFLACYGGKLWILSWCLNRLLVRPRPVIEYQNQNIRDHSIKTSTAHLPLPLNSLPHDVSVRLVK